jgi:sugar lactone lactonase YvrE
VTGELTPVSVETAELGECARWDADRREFLWVDIMAGVLRRAVEDGDRLRTVAEVSIGEPLGAITRTAGAGCARPAAASATWPRTGP